MQFKVISSDDGAGAESNQDSHSRIEKMISENPVFLFMKGTPESPQCGFSYKVVDILKAWNVPYNSFDVLSDESIRQGVKDYANYSPNPLIIIPTIVGIYGFILIIRKAFRLAKQFENAE